MADEQKAHCCHIGCDEPATWRIQSKDDKKDYTEMCSYHLMEYRVPGDEITPL